MIYARTIVAAGLALALAACGGGDPEIEDQSIEPTAPAEDTLPLTPDSAPAYVGVWAADPDDCDVSPGSAVPAPIAITEGEFIGYENRCRIGDMVEGTEGGYQVALVCESEGVEYSENIELDVDGVMLRMTRDGEDEAIFTRCDEDDQQ